MRIDTSTPIVTFKGDDYRALGIVRSLGRLGIPITVLSDSAKSLAALSRFCSGFSTWSFASEPDEVSLSFLLRIAKQFDKRPVLIPGSDQCSLLADRIRADLASAYLIPPARTGSVRYLYDKKSLWELCLQAGVPTPTTMFPATPDDALMMSKELRRPYVLKAIDPDRMMRTSSLRMLTVACPTDLIDACRSLHDRDSSNLMLQEFVPAEPAARGIVSAYFGGNGRPAFALTGTKLRQLPVTGGVTSLAVCQPIDGLVELLQRIVGASGYRGPLDADFVYDKRDKLWKLLDVNPRLGANFRAFVDRNGLDAARVMYLDLTGQAIPEVSPAWGRRWMSEHKEFGAMRTEIAEGTLTYRGWWQSVRGVDELAYWDCDDLRPSLRFAADFAGDRARGMLRRLTRSMSRAG